MSIAELFTLKDQVSVVIGGARDFGIEMATALGETGSDLVITSRRFESAEASAKELSSDLQREVLPLELDVCDFAAVERAARKAYRWKGHIDVLVNNAGGGLSLVPSGFFQRKPEHMDQLIKTNLTGILYCCQQFGKLMAEQGHGKMINIASIAGMIGRDRRLYANTSLPEQPIDYAAAKGGVLGMTRDLAAFLAPMGVHVNAISPGGFERGQGKAFIDAYSARTPLGRMGRDGIDLKGAIVYLASAASDYVTGHNLVVDGGYTTWN